MPVGNASWEIWHSTSANGRDWTPDVKIGQQSKDTPALARSGGVVHLAHLGESSNQVWHATYNGAAGKFRSNHQTNQLSRQQPALAAGALGADPALILAHIGDESSRLYASRYNPSLRTLLAVDPDHKGDFGDSNLSAGDLDAVRFMYG